MVIANGFISPNKDAALEEVKKLCKGSEVRVAVMPPLCTMPYFISNIGEMWGCQQMKNFCLTKPLKPEQRYSIGVNIRYAVGGGKQKPAYMQYIMYFTYVLGYWDENLQLETKDGNVYNYQLSNIKVKDEDYRLFVNNMDVLKHVYKSSFLDVSWYAKYVCSDIDFEDAKDIASKAFYELCNIPHQYEPSFFVGLWKNMVRKRVYDYLDYRNRFTDSLWHEDGEERYGNTDSDVEVADLWWLIRGDKCRQIMKLYAEGETPTEIAEQIGSKRASVASCITRTIQHLQGIYARDIAI